MRVLFLDIDGVLNSVQSAVMYHRMKEEGKLPEHLSAYDEHSFCPVSISNLTEIVKQVKDLKIVVSSTWRLGADVREMKSWFENISPRIAERIIDSTPLLNDQQRGEEIIYWLRSTKLKVKKFAVVDDDTDMDAVEDDFFKTSNCTGLTWQVARDIVDHLAYPEEEIGLQGE